jgi:hypothetical protein
MNLSLCGVAFATNGVDNFMSSVMGIDKHDLVSKMEGFAVQGIQGEHSHIYSKYVRILLHCIGAAKNHQERVSQLRGQVRETINHKLRKLVLC